MFAVPGWSLSSASLKTLKDVHPPGGNSSALSQGLSKKRKRGAAIDTVIRGEDVDDLWKRHIEGVTPTPKLKKTVQHSQKREFSLSKAKTSAITSSQPFSMQDIHDGGAIGSTTRATVKSKKSNQRPKVRPVKTLLPNSEEHAALEAPRSDSRMDISVDGNLKSHLTPLQAAMRQKLVGARFRHLNQTMYTTPSTETKRLFDMNPNFFKEYHEGFCQQTSSWPENPVDGYMEELKQRCKIPNSICNAQRSAANSNNEDNEARSVIPVLPRTNGTCIVADLGCGDARLANQAKKLSHRYKIRILSYDLHSSNSMVKEADMANLPDKDGSVNVAIFCLSLMGTNWLEFIEEAWRVLHWKGELWIAEIRSRFQRASKKRVEHSVGYKKKQPTKDDLRKQKHQDEEVAGAQLAVEVDGVDDERNTTDVSAFVEVLRRRGFALENEHAIDLRNKMFVKMKFLKALPPVVGKNFKQSGKGTAGIPVKSQFLASSKEGDVDEAVVLKPCLYKIR